MWPTSSSPSNVKEVKHTTSEGRGLTAPALASLGRRASKGPPHPRRKQLTGLQQHQHQPPTTVAIIGANTLFVRILVRLLNDEGYDTRVLEEAYSTGHIDESLDSVDLLLFPPNLDTDLREAFLNAIGSTPEAAHRVVPVLSLPVSLQVAFFDELAVNVSWQSLFEELVQEIEAALTGAAASTEELGVPVEAGEQPKEIPSSTQVA